LSHSLFPDSLKVKENGILIEYLSLSFYFNCNRHVMIIIQVMVVWVVMLCSDVVGYQYVRGPCCLHLHFILKMEMVKSSGTFVFCHIATQHNIQKTTTQCCENFKSHNVIQASISLCVCVCVYSYHKCLFKC